MQIYHLKTFKENFHSYDNNFLFLRYNPNKRDVDLLPRINFILENLLIIVSCLFKIILAKLNTTVFEIHVSLFTFVISKLFISRFPSYHII